MANQETKVKLVAEISASSNGLISALKQASGAINDSTQSWSSKFSQLKDSTSLISQSVKNLGDLVKKVGDVDMSVDVEGMDKVNASISEVSKVFETVQREVNTFTQQLVEMKNAASELGMPVDEYQRFADAVKASGMSLEEGNTLIKNMQHSILDLANGVPEAKDTFAKLGLSIEQLSSNTAVGNFDAIVQAMQSVVQPTEQAKASMELFKTSMEHAINVSQEYNKLLVEQTNNTYATDKDVQTSISLAGAVEKLGEQLGKYASDAGNATNATQKTGRSFEELFAIIKENHNILADLYVEYANWVESVKNSVSSTLDASTALRVFNDQVKEYINQKPNRHTHSLQVNLEQLLAFVQVAKDKITDEMTAIHGIINQRLRAGAPIDTKELEIAESHVEMLTESLTALQELLNNQKNAGKVIDNEALDTIDTLIGKLDEARNNFQRLGSSAEFKNVALGLQEAREASEEFTEQVEKANDALKKGKKFKFDTKALDQAREKLMKLKEQVEKFERSHKDRELFRIGEELAKIDQLSAKMGEINTKAESFGHKVYTAFRHPIEALKDLIAAVRDYTNATNEAKNASANMGKSTKAQAQQIAGQLFGMGSQVAIVAKGFRTIGKFIKMYVIDPLTRANEEMRKMVDFQSKAQISTAENNIKRFKQMEEDLKKYAETVKKYNEDGNEVDRVSMEQQQRMLSAQYGIDANPQNINRVMEENFAWSKNGRKDAIESQIRALEKLNKALDEEYKERNSYWKNDLGRSLEEKERGKQRMVDIRKEQGENNERIFDLKNQLRMMGFENNLGDWRKQQRAEAIDKRREEEEEAQEKAEEERKKALEEQAKALEEATKKLNDWGNSLTDNDRQKNLRTIMQKYEEAVKGGVSEKEAEKVAVQAINKMLEKEKEDEDKANKELLRAVEERIKQYKNAYKAYQDANKAVIDAKKAYARTEEDLAKENRAERISKRRERIAKKIGQFGFAPYAGFKMDESSSERRERKRNAQIDASIAEKMGRSEAGGRVRWTRAEKERLAEYNKLQKKDKSLEAAQKQMDAAEKQKKAADALSEAAKAIRQAVFGRDDAGKGLKEAGKNLKEASNKRMKKSENKSAEEIFKGARKGLTAKGIGTAMGQRQISYNGQLDTLHKDLQDLNKRIYVVR